MNGKIMRIGAVVLVFALMVSLSYAAPAQFAGGPFAAAPVYAAPLPDEVLQVTGYKIMKKGSTKAYSGKIRKDDEITIEIYLCEGRPLVSSNEPVAVLNTTSFTTAASNISASSSAVTHGDVYTVTIKNLKYTGKGKTFLCNIYYKNSQAPMQEVSLTFNQCVEYKAPPKDGGTTEPPSTEPPSDTPSDTPPDSPNKSTGFVLKDAQYGNGGGEPIYAGKAFSLSAVILATNGSSAVENVSVSFSPPEELTLADGSSVSYVGTMAPGASAAVNTVLLPGANIQEGSYIVGIDVTGVNQKSGDLVSAQMTVSIPILQPERFEIFNTTLPTDLMAGTDNGMGYGNVTLVNQGRGTVANVSLEIVGDGLWTDDGKQFIGNVGAGEQRSSDFSLHADEAGTVEAKVVVSYENVRGEIKTLEQEFTINVMDGGFEDPGFIDPGFVEPGMEPGMEGRQGVPKWLWIAIGAAAAVVVIVLLVRRRRKKRIAAEEALDDIDDDD